jgi:hypothetical protein
LSVVAELVVLVEHLTPVMMASLHPSGQYQRQVVEVVEVTVTGGQVVLGVVGEITHSQEEQEYQDKDMMVEIHNQTIKVVEVVEEREKKAMLDHQQITEGLGETEQVTILTY